MPSFPNPSRLIAKPARSEAGAAKASADESEIDLFEILAQLFKGKFTILASVLLFAVAGVAYSIAVAPVYQADALLQLEERSGRLALPDSMSGLLDSSPKTMTEIEIIRSRLVLSRASAELSLDQNLTPRLMPVIGNALTRYDIPLPPLEMLTPYLRFGETATLDALQVPPEWVGKPMLITSLGQQKYQIELPDGRALLGRAAESLTDPATGFNIRLGVLEAPRGREFLAVQRSPEAATNSLIYSLSVSEQGRGTGVLKLTFTSASPDEAQRRLNAIAAAYLSQNIDRSSAEAQSSLTFVEQQLPEAEKKVRDAESALNQYKSDQRSVNLDLETQSLLGQIQSLEAELRALDGKEEELRNNYTPSHPAYRQLMTKRARVEADLEALREETELLPETQREILNLTQSLELAQAVYVQLVNRSQELKVLRASSIGNVRIIDKALASNNPIAPRKSLIVALFLVLGVFVGIATVLIRNLVNRGIQGPDQLEDIGLAVYATVNLVAPRYQVLDRKTNPRLIAIEDPADLAVEAMRSLRTSLHFGLLDAETRSLAITSAAPQAGKSFLSANLAVVMAMAGQKICLVEADMRRGALRRYFGIAKNTPGLAEVLSGSALLEEVLVQGPVPGLFILPSGKYPPNPSELLMRSTFRDTLNELDKTCDLTIVDTPPVLAVTDPIIIGKACGAMIAVVRHATTSMAEVNALVSTLDGNGLRLSGVVLNGFDPRKAKSTYSYSYNYGYKYDYKSNGD